MKVTVADCLELKAFAGAEVVAGKLATRNAVNAISVLESCEEEDLKLFTGDKAEILLTGFLGIKDDVEAQVKTLETVASKGCAALAICFVEEGIGAIDDKLVQAAEECGLPLIKMPEGIRYAEVINQVIDRVLYGDNFRNSLINNTVFHLLNFEKHSSFQSAVKEAAINNEFQVVLLSEDFNPIFTVETRHEVPLAEAIRQGKEKNLEREANKVYTLINVEGTLTYWGLVTIGGEKYYMLIVDNEDSYSAGEITKLAEIIELAMGMWKYTPERDAKSEFLKALIRGNKSLAYTLQDEARISGEDIVSTFFIKDMPKDTENQIFADFEKKTDLEVMRIVESDETYGMILNMSEGDSTTQQQQDCTALFNKIKENKTTRIFHVTGINGIEGAGDSYKLISESWNLVQNVFPYKRVFTKYELTLVSNCINIHIQSGFVKKNYMELLEPFKKTGENKGRQLLDTLETFVLDAGMNSGKTAEFMDIHANTVQYRLKKINEMLGVEVTGNRVIPGLTMALALKRLERTVS